MSRFAESATFESESKEVLTARSVQAQSPNAGRVFEATVTFPNREGVQRIDADEIDQKEK
ncbi:hypothetical protein [Chromobacterium haemolyticum]|uniref:hypothetical protein n=1 Tax=Chromobacterium haemolyticum TaxID=394935 RepID=UPI001130F791|nr:hypothetical protein [Chromobacterium haemolyticum]